MLSVSITRLDRLGRDLQAASTAIVRHSRGDLEVQLAHDGPVTKAMVSVEHDWSRQRAAITDYLTQVGMAAHGAARLYEAVEVEVRRAALTTGLRVVE